MHEHYTSSTEVTERNHLGGREEKNPPIGSQVTISHMRIIAKEEKMEDNKIL